MTCQGRKRGGRKRGHKPFLPRGGKGVISLSCRFPGVSAGPWDAESSRCSAIWPFWMSIAHRHTGVSGHAQDAGRRVPPRSAARCPRLGDANPLHESRNRPPRKMQSHGKHSLCFLPQLLFEVYDPSTQFWAEARTDRNVCPTGKLHRRRLAVGGASIANPGRPVTDARGDLGRAAASAPAGERPSLQILSRRRGANEINFIFQLTLARLVHPYIYLNRGRRLSVFVASCVRSPN